jgi:hypothetical protein
VDLRIHNRLNTIFLGSLFVWQLIAIPIFGKGDKVHFIDSLSNYTNAISAQWIGLVFHPNGGTYPARYIRKLDPNAYFVVEQGLFLGYEHRVFDRAYIKTAAAYNMDCANVPAGFLHIGFYYQIVSKKRHKLSVGLGPTFVFREDWHQFPEYIEDEFFKDSVYGKWQYRFVIFGDIEYNYQISRKTLLNVSLIPGGHLVMTFSFGLKYVLK